MDLETVSNLGQKIRNKSSGLIVVITGSYVGGYVVECLPESEATFGKLRLPFGNIDQWETVED
jgi:hypothetical protein